MSLLNISELKSAVLTVLTTDEVREFGDLRKKSTWEAAHAAIALPDLSAWVPTDEKLADMTVQSVVEPVLPVQTHPVSDELVQTVVSAIGTAKEVSSMVSTTLVATAIVALDYGHIAWTWTRKAWTTAEPYLVQAALYMFTVALMATVGLYTATCSTYLVLERTILELAFWTSPQQVLVPDGWVVTQDEPLLIGPAS